MAAEEHALLTTTDGAEWILSDPEGKTLAVITSTAPEPPLGAAAATLVGDHGYQPGRWEQRKPGQHTYVTE
ncbi:hypothetical protein [Gordonia sihwensis]|uniref:hypothetical protein n=1 Tax=Gordonia sihwensis TaxID=173559 RepID=UPI003D9575B9